MSDRRPKVAYVLGVYRSGTTLLSNLLGQLDGFFCVGELRAIWRELNLSTARCGCGVPFVDDRTWQTILEEAFGGIAEARRLAPDILRLQEQTVGRTHTWRRVPALLRHRDLRSAGDSMQRYADVLSRLYRAIATVTGARVIVDSSKEPTDAAMIRLLPDVSPFFVHIVRDPRGVVFSSRRALSGGRAPERYEAARVGYVAMSWVAGNAAASAVRRAVGSERSFLIRYEDLVATPRLSLEGIARSLGEAVAVPEGEIVMAPTHTVCGNENRFRTGPVHLVQDTAWRNGFSRLHRGVVSAVCAPWMKKYGYGASVGK